MNALQIAAIGWQSDQEHIRVISHNVANIATPGFKREVPLSGDFQATLGQAESLRTNGALGLQAGAVALDFAQGALAHTGSNLDLAVEGDAFLELASTSGKLVTRGGHFKLDSDGRLVTQDGLALLGAQGEIVLPPQASSVSIDASGAVFVNGEKYDELKLVRFENVADLRPVEGGHYQADTAKEDASLSSKGNTVRAGYLESSNVSSVQQMVELMQTSRHLETMQRAIQAYDEVLETSLRKFGDQ
jgi:flagellar basal-body rod protein FlgG